MPTDKKRINVSLDKETEEVLRALSERDDVPQATKAMHLIKLAIEIDEDEVFNKVAEKRDTSDTKFVSHDDAWL